MSVVDLKDVLKDIQPPQVADTSPRRTKYVFSHPVAIRRIKITYKAF